MKHACFLREPRTDIVVSHQLISISPLLLPQISLRFLSDSSIPSSSWFWATHLIFSLPFPFDDVIKTRSENQEQIFQSFHFWKLIYLKKLGRSLSYLIRELFTWVLQSGLSCLEHALSYLFIPLFVKSWRVHPFFFILPRQFILRRERFFLEGTFN